MTDTPTPPKKPHHTGRDKPVLRLPTTPRPQNGKEITADNLEKMIHRNEQHGTIPMPGGEMRPVTIPAPTEDDIAWAKQSFEEDQEWRNKQASAAIIDGNLWRLHFLLAVNKQKDGFIDINSFGTKDDDYTLLGHTTLVEDEDRLDFAALLLSYGADTEKCGNTRFSRSGKRKYTPLVSAIENGRIELIELFLDNGAHFYKEDFSEAETAPTKAYLAHRFSMLEDDSAYRNLNTPAAHGSKWAIIDNHAVAKISYIPGKMRLTKTFNFLSQEIDKVTEVLDTDGEVKSVSFGLTQSFDDVRHKEEIKQAHAKLKSLGGKPEALENYTRHTHLHSSAHRNDSPPKPPTQMH